MGLGFPIGTVLGHTVQSTAEKFWGNHILGQTQVQSHCGQDQSNFYSMTRQLRVKAKRQVTLGCGETEQKARMSGGRP